MQERYIIECKYLEGMFWSEIEINFNNKFRQKNYITVAGIRKMNSDALNMLLKILEPFIIGSKSSRFGTVFHFYMCYYVIVGKIY